MDNNWERVYYGNQIHSIEIVRASLMENDIKCVIIDKRASGYLIGDIEVFVRNEDAILAKIIIENLF
jgi:hypothetical protein